MAPDTPPLTLPLTPPFFSARALASPPLSPTPSLSLSPGLLAHSRRDCFWPGPLLLCHSSSPPSPPALGNRQPPATDGTAQTAFLTPRRVSAAAETETETTDLSPLLPLSCCSNTAPLDHHSCTAAAAGAVAGAAAPVSMGNGSTGTADTVASWSPPHSPVSPNSSKRMQKERERERERERRGSETPRTEQYIKHLETQLAALTESVSSRANAGVVRKVKQLSQEKAILKQELEEWEKSFDDRLQDELRTTRQKETQLAAQVRALQINNRLKDVKLTEQARDLKQTRQSLRDAQTTNKELEHRIDDLTGLLASSPVVPRQQSRPRPQSMHGRPTSRFSESHLPSPRLPVRPASMLEGKTKENDLTLVRRRTTAFVSLGGGGGGGGSESPAAPAHGESTDGTETPHAAPSDDKAFAADTAPTADQSSSRLTDSDQYWNSSQQSTMSSPRSVSDLSLSPKNLTKRHSMPVPPKRKMRKFRADNNRLKPLVLQTAPEESVEPPKPVGRARCYSLPHTGSTHLPPQHLLSSAPLRLVHAQSEVAETVPESPDTTPKRELARARTLSALEGGATEYQLAAGHVSMDSESTLMDEHSNLSLDDASFAARQVSGSAASSSTFVQRSTSPLVSDGDPDAADVFRMSDLSLSLWQAPPETLEAELQQQRQRQGDFTSSEGTAATDQQHPRTGSPTPGGSRAVSYRRRYRRPTVDRILRSDEEHGRFRASSTLYRSSPFDTDGSPRKASGVYAYLPRTLVSDPPQSLQKVLFSATNQLICNTRHKMRQLQGLWLGSLSWMVLGLFLHRRETQGGAATSERQPAEAVLVEAPEPHRNQMSLIDGFRHTMARRLRVRIESLSRPVIERSRTSRVLNAMRSWTQLVAVMVFALGFAARNGPSDLIEIQAQEAGPEGSNAERCPLCGAALKQQQQPHHHTHDHRHAQPGSPCPSARPLGMAGVTHSSP